MVGTPRITIYVSALKVTCGSGECWFRCNGNCRQRVIRVHVSIAALWPLELDQSLTVGKYRYTEPMDKSALLATSDIVSLSRPSVESTSRAAVMIRVTVATARGCDGRARIEGLSVMRTGMLLLFYGLSRSTGGVTPIGLPCV